MRIAAILIDSSTPSPAKPTQRPNIVKLQRTTNYKYYKY